MTITTSKYYSVTKTLSRPLPTWVNNDDDALRVAAYDAYLDMFRNVPGTFKLVFRGEEDHPIYIPSAKKMVEATNRYLGKDWATTVASASANENDRILAQTAIDTLWKREEMLATFASLKRNSLIKGDAVLHITFNATAAPGERISIHEVDARNFFRIPDPTDVKKLIGCYIVELIFADDGRTQIVRRLAYTRNENGTIHTQLTFWTLTGWDDRWVGHPPLSPAPVPEAYNIPELTDLLAGFDLPPSVTALPVYHFRNNRESGEPFGSSELAGVETLISALNQGASDEDISLALQGLGVYSTTASRPVNAQGEETDWVIAPGSVLEMQPGAAIDRIAGIGSVTPYQDHFSMLNSEMRASAGVSNVAIGNVDVQIAQSGVALRLDMAPILAKNAEKELEFTSKLDQFVHDLLFYWMPLDGFSPAVDISATNSFSDPLPVDRAGTIAEVTALLTAGLISKEFAVGYLNVKLGFNFPADMLATATAEADATAARMAAELATGAPASPSDSLATAGVPTGGGA